MRAVRNLDSLRLAAKAGAAARLLRALANENRLLILCALVEGERSVECALRAASRPIERILVAVASQRAAGRYERLARLAELQLDSGELEAACGTWQRFLQDCRHLRSRRVGRVQTSLLARLRRYRNSSAVITLRMKVPAP